MQKETLLKRSHLIIMDLKLRKEGENDRNAKLFRLESLVEIY